MFRWLIRFWRFLFSGRPSSTAHVPAVPRAVELVANAQESSPAVNQPKHVLNQGVSSPQRSSPAKIQEPEVLPADIPTDSVLIGPKRQREWVEEIEAKLERSREEARIRKIAIERMEKEDRELHERVKKRHEGQRKVIELKQRGEELVNKIYHSFTAIPKASSCEDTESIDEIDSQIEEVEELIDQHRKVMSELEQLRKDSGL